MSEHLCMIRDAAVSAPVSIGSGVVRARLVILLLDLGAKFVYLWC